MTTKNKPEKKAREIISDKTVLSLTGFPKEHWFEQADKMGAAGLSVHNIFDLFNTMTGLVDLGEWNRGLLATAYTWDRGIRKRGEKKDGFEISASKTIAAPAEMLFQYWTDEKKRRQWVSEPIKITRSTEGRSVRAQWAADESRLSIEFYGKNAGKTQVVVQQMKLATEKDAAAAKEFWSEKLALLKKILEG